jgi:hypothetical protein
VSIWEDQDRKRKRLPRTPDSINRILGFGR